MKKLKILLSCLLSLFVIFSVIPLSSQAYSYNYENSQYLTINPAYLFGAFYGSTEQYTYGNVIEFHYNNKIIQFYFTCGTSQTNNPSMGILNGSPVLSIWSNSLIYWSYYNGSVWSDIIKYTGSNDILNLMGGSTVRDNFVNTIYSQYNDSHGYFFTSFYLNQDFYNNSEVFSNFSFSTGSPFTSNKSYTLKSYVPDIITAAVILGVENSGGSGSGSGSVDTTSIINAIIQAREYIIDTVEDGDDYIQSMLVFMAQILYGDLSGNNNDPSVEEILDSGAINILDYYFKDYFNQLYNFYKNENNQIVNAIWQALNTGNSVSAADNVSAINALKAAIRDEIANSGQLSYIEYVSYIVDYLDVFYMALYDQNTEILEKVDRLLTILSSNTATITNRIQQSENNIIDGINDAGENTGSPDLSHTGLDSALSQGSGWASQILSASAVIDQATQNVANYLDSGSSILNSILTSFPIFGVILSFVLVFFLVRKVIGR